VAPPSRTCLPDRSEAEGPAANRQAATKPHPPRPWPSHRKATAPNPCLPTGAKRSGGICSHPSGGNKTPPSTPPAIAQENHCSQLCHPDRSEAKRRDLQSPFIPQQHPHLRRPQPPHRKATTPTFCHPDRSEAERRDLQSPFSSQQNPTFDAPSHRTGKPPLQPLSSRPERSGAEGSAVTLQAATKPHLRRPQPPHRKATAPNICHPDRSEAQRRDLQSPFIPQQNPTFDAPSHRTGKPLLQPLSSRPERSGAEGSAVTLQAATKTLPSTPPATAQESYRSNICHPDRSGGICSKPLCVK
jgi:hypothetical protein